MKRLVAPILSWIDLDASADSLAAGVEWLHPDEIKNAARFATPTLRSRAQNTRVFVRATLACMMRKSPQAITFELGRYGKPRVVGGPQFNLCHSGSIAVIGAHQTCPVGVDVEHCSRIVDGTALDATLSANEKISPPQNSDNWLRLWVRKEAAIKALGLGLHADLTALDVGDQFHPPGIWRPIETPIPVVPVLQLTDLILPTQDPVAVAMATAATLEPISQIEAGTLDDLLAIATLLFDGRV